MNSIFRFLNKEMNYLNTNREKWMFVTFISVFVFLFLLVFQPFGVNNFDPNNTINLVFFLSMLGFAVLQGLVLALCEFILVPLMIKRSTVFHVIIRIALELVLLSAFTFLYYNILGNFHDWRLSSFFEFLFNITVMGIIPYTMVILFLNYQQTKKVVQLMETRPKFQLSDAYIDLKSNNGKEQLTIKLSNLRYIEAQDNYVLIYHLDKEALKKQLLRTTMKDIENNLKNQSVVRCHRSYIVNMNIIEKVKRLGHQMELYLPNVTLPIPVSRSFLPQIESILDTHHT